MKEEDIEFLCNFSDKRLHSIALKEKKKREYNRYLKQLQVELLKLQDWIYEGNRRLMIIFEGRDAAGKGSTIKRFIEHLNPRKFNIVALPKPTEIEKGQFYFQRYFKHLPNPGEIAFFDRSWYNRAIVEPLFGFCTKKQYEQFMNIVPEVENALIEDGILLIKIWLDISKETQAKRFKERMENPLKYWKLSPIDLKAQEVWDEAANYQKEMFKKTATNISPWVIVNSNNQKRARVAAIRYVLSKFDYKDKNDQIIGDPFDSGLIKIIGGNKDETNKS